MAKTLPNYTKTINIHNQKVQQIISWVNPKIPPSDISYQNTESLIVTREKQLIVYKRITITTDSHTLNNVKQKAMGNTKF